MLLGSALWLRLMQLLRLSALHLQCWPLHCWPLSCWMNEFDLPMTLHEFTVQIVRIPVTQYDIMWHIVRIPLTPFVYLEVISHLSHSLTTWCYFKSKIFWLCSPLFSLVCCYHPRFDKWNSLKYFKIKLSKCNWHRCWVNFFLSSFSYFWLNLIKINESLTMQL